MNIGTENRRVLFGVNARVDQTIDLSQWIGGNPVGRAGDEGPLARVFDQFRQSYVFTALGS